MVTTTLCRSQAEYLAKLLPHSKVVKAFNTLSAYSLTSGGLQGSKQVYKRHLSPETSVLGDSCLTLCCGCQVMIAGDDVSARDIVARVVRGAGFTPVDLGCLSSARSIEDIPVSVFPLWRVPFYIHLSIFCFLYILGFVKFQVSFLGKGSRNKGEVMN